MHAIVITGMYAHTQQRIAMCYKIDQTINIIPATHALDGYKTLHA
jgi:hypothetical protein